MLPCIHVKISTAPLTGVAVPELSDGRSVNRGFVIQDYLE